MKKLKIIYSQLSELQKQLPNQLVPNSVVSMYNVLVNELQKISEQNFPYLEITIHDRWDDRYFKHEAVKSKIALAVGTLKGLLEIEESNVPQQIINVLNQNENTLAVKIEQTIQQIAQEQGDQDVKNKLEELSDVLEKKDKNRLVKIIQWLLDKGLVDIFFKILPEILKRMGS